MISSTIKMKDLEVVVLLNEKSRIPMTQITLSFPDETILALKLNPEKMADEIKLAASIKLYELGRLSSGAAAKLAGIPKPVFLSKLADYGVKTFHLSEDELRTDMENA